MIKVSRNYNYKQVVDRKDKSFTDKLIWIRDDIRFQMKRYKELNNKRPESCHIKCGLDVYDVMKNPELHIFYDIVASFECCWDMELYVMEIEIV